MPVIYTEFDNGLVLATTDTSGKRAIPGSVFRFGGAGRTGEGWTPVEIYQRGGVSATTSLRMPEGEVRAFLTGLGLIEAGGITAEFPLKEIADRIAPAGGA
jgi:hypothetical protein